MNEEQLILKRIEELEKYQKEQAEVLDNIEDRLSDLEINESGIISRLI